MEDKPMSDFKSDNIFQRIRIPLEALCCVSAITWPDAIRPENAPLLTEVEEVREKGASANAPQIATRYNLVFPGSDYMRLSVKVEETAPSIALEMLKKYPRGVPVNVQGFYCGAFITKDGGAMPYYKAERITPMQTHPNRPNG